MSRKTLVPISHLSSSSDPTLPALRAGDTYANSTSKALRTYDGAAWHEHDTLDLATTLSGAKTFTGGVVVNTTGITGNKEINLTGTGASSVGGTLQGTAVIAAGLTGSTAASRYVGATATGAPTTGAHLVGDWVITQDGHIFICTVAGTPGTWANGGAAVTAAVSVTSETTYGIASAVGTSTNYARQDHTHGTPATPATSVAGRTGAVTLTAADIAAGTFPGANTFSGLQTFNAGVTLPSGQALTTGTRSVVTGTRATTTNASDTVDLGTFATTAGTIELRVHAHLVSGAAGATASVTKIYELALNNAMGTTNTWYLCYPADSSANAAASNDFALEVQRTSGTTFNFRFRQKSIAAVGVITWTAETLGDTAVTFTASTTVTAAPAAVSTMHPSNAFVAAAGQIGIGTEAPAALLDVAGTSRAVQFTPTGATGATAASAYIGGTASGAPTTGTHAVGDHVVDQTGKIWVCTVAGTPGTWVTTRSTFIGCRLFLSTAQAVASSASSAITFDSESFDTDGFHSTVSNTSRITIPTGLAGKYRITALVDYPANSTGIRYCFIRKNGTAGADPTGMIVPAGATEIAADLATVMDLVAGDFIELFGWQTSGGSLSVFSGAGSTRFEAEYLGP